MRHWKSGGELAVCCYDGVNSSTPTPAKEYEQDYSCQTELGAVVEGKKSHCRGPSAKAWRGQTIIN